MKAFLARKKEKDSLRPLSEKEIQEKLYGDFHEGTPPMTEETKVDLGLQSGRKKESFSVRPEKSPLPRINWLELKDTVLKFLTPAAIGLKSVVAKLISGWGIGILGVIFLFLAVYGLNEYRAKAMKVSKVASPSAHKEAASLSRPSSEESQLEPTAHSHVAAPTVEEQVTKEPAPLPPAPPSTKPYVIQVCIYVREQDAEKLVGEMVQMGFAEAFSEPIRRASTKSFYPVFLGRYSTFQTAQEELARFRKKPAAKTFQDSFVRTL